MESLGFLFSSFEFHYQLPLSTSLTTQNRFIFLILYSFKYLHRATTKSVKTITHDWSELHSLPSLLYPMQLHLHFCLFSSWLRYILNGAGSLLRGYIRSKVSTLLLRSAWTCCTKMWITFCKLLWPEWKMKLWEKSQKIFIASTLFLVQFRNRIARNRFHQLLMSWLVGESLWSLELFEIHFSTSLTNWPPFAIWDLIARDWGKSSDRIIRFWLIACYSKLWFKEIQ